MALEGSFWRTSSSFSPEENISPTRDVTGIAAPSRNAPEDPFGLLSPRTQVQPERQHVGQSTGYIQRQVKYAPPVLCVRSCMCASCVYRYLCLPLPFFAIKPSALYHNYFDTRLLMDWHRHWLMLAAIGIASALVGNLVDLCIQALYELKTRVLESHIDAVLLK